MNRKGKTFLQKETWWWSEEVQAVIKDKRKKFKFWQRSRNTQDLEEYKDVKRLARNVAAKVTALVFEEL